MVLLGVNGILDKGNTTVFCLCFVSKQIYMHVFACVMNAASTENLSIFLRRIGSTSVAQSTFLSLFTFLLVILFHSVLFFYGCLFLSIVPSAVPTRTLT